MVTPRPQVAQPLTPRWRQGAPDAPIGAHRPIVERRRSAPLLCVPLIMIGAGPV
jgi:hypothetical protein